MRVLALLILLIPRVSFGFGETGHRAVCQIAYDELTPAASSEVSRLIALDPEYDTFADSCLFADGPPRHRTEDHYLNVPRSYRAITTAKCPMADTCLFPAIESDTAVFADTNNSDGDRLLALKMLGHWLGDIHQPLHISFQDDRGANSIWQVGGEENGNLHGAWDFDIVDRQLGADYLQIAAKLHADISARDRSEWMFDSPVEWANESYQITISPKVQYCTEKQGACWYSKNNMMLNPGEAWREVDVTKRYTARHRKTIELRIKQAGIRLAELLNSALEPGVAEN